MPNKIFSIYGPQTNDDETNNERLIVEIAKTHIACVAKSETENTISGFEIFRLKDSEIDFSEVFSYIQSESQLLLKTYTASKVFVQNEMSVLIPGDVFKKELADDYLDSIVGESSKVVTMTDEIKVDGGLMNAFRVPMNTLSILHLNMGGVSVEHTYSQIIRGLFSVLKSTSGQLIKVQFYYDHIIAAVVSGKTLQLIQTFSYQTPADVLYHLLNISQRLNLDAENMVLEISGMIDQDSPMYTELFNYFKNVSVEEPDKNLFHQDAHEFPAHYFTPIFNLAV